MKLLKTVLAQHQRCRALRAQYPRGWGNEIESAPIAVSAGRASYATNSEEVLQSYPATGSVKLASL
jgi:hypothetical protein